MKMLNGKPLEWCPIRSCQDSSYLQPKDYPRVSFHIKMMDTRRRFEK
ncbi:hypothetical protein Gotur_027609 [Gossypium turneri]